MRKPLRTAWLIIWTASSLAACGISRPSGFICLNDVPRHRQLCYDLKHDYDDDGKLKPGATQKVKAFESGEAMLQALDKNTTFDPDTWAEVKSYLHALKEECKKD